MSHTAAWQRKEVLSARVVAIACPAGGTLPRILLFQPLWEEGCFEHEHGLPTRWLAGSAPWAPRPTADPVSTNWLPSSTAYGRMCSFFLTYMAHPVHTMPGLQANSDPNVVEPTCPDGSEAVQDPDTGVYR